MIIKLIPETEEEKANYASKNITEVIHSGVREYMLFGNRIDQDGDLEDFHEWHGSYRYMMGSLNYFYETINDKRRALELGPQQVPLRLANNPGMIKRGGITPEIEPIDISQLRQEESPQEAGAFDDEEAKAVATDNVELSVEELEEQADAIRAQHEDEKDIKPNNLKVIR